MKAEEIYGSIYHRVMEMNRIQKFRLCSLILPELQTEKKKRGKLINKVDAERKLRRDFKSAFTEEQNAQRNNSRKVSVRSKPVRMVFSAE